MLNLTLHDAASILVINQEKNLTHAAQKLLTSQPSLTQLLQRLETQLGTRLFYREGRKIIPTKEGRLFVKACQSLCQTGRNFENQLHELSKQHQGSVIVGAPFNIGAYLFPILYKTYKLTYPHIKFIPVEAKSDSLEQLLLDNEIDLIVMPPRPTFSSIVDTVTLMKEHMVMSIPKDHPLNKQAVYIPGERHPYIDVRATDGADYILSAPGQLLYEACNKIFKAANITPHSVFVSRSFEAKKNLSAAGMGLTIFPEHYHEFYQSSLEANYYYLLPPCDFTWDINVYYREKDLSFSVITECIEILTNLFQHEPISLAH